MKIPTTKEGNYLNIKDLHDIMVPRLYNCQISNTLLMNPSLINMSHGQNVRCDFLMYMLKKAFSWFLDKMGA